MKRIHILENALRYLLDEGRNAEKAKQKTIAVMKNYLSQNGVQGGQLESMAMEYESSFKEWLFHANMPDSIIRLEPIMANVAMQLGFTPQNRSTRELYRLKDITNYIIANYNKEDFPIVLNKLTLDNTTFERLNELFGSAIDTSKGVWKPSNDGKPKPHYTVKRLDTFEEAHKYHRYTQDICYLGGENTWINYTDGGRNAVYVLLRDGWQDIPAEHGENTPYDDYGKSMVFVIIRPDGDVAYTNTRWNHNTNGNGPIDVDQSFTDNMNNVSDMLQTDYRNVLKPYSEEDLEKKGAMTISILRRLLSQGENILAHCKHIENIGDLYKIYISNNSFVIFSPSLNKLIPSDGVELTGMYQYQEDFIIIQNKDYKRSFLNKNGQQIGGWYSQVRDFYEGFAAVKQHNGSWTFINTEGQQICEWYANVKDFHDGLAIVSENSENWSAINTEGQRICGWYSFIEDFYNGLSIVDREDGKESLINTQGQQISDWFSMIFPSSPKFYTVRGDDGKWTLINKEGKQIHNWYRDIRDCGNGMVCVQIDNGKWILISMDEQQASKPYKYIAPFDKGFAQVKREDGKESLINTQGQQICDWYDEVYNFNNDGLAMVKREDGKWSLINTNGQLICGWFDSITNFRRGMASVTINGKYYFIDKKGNLFDENQQLVSISNESRQKLNSLIHESLYQNMKDYLLYN